MSKLMQKVLLVLILPLFFLLRFHSIPAYASEVNQEEISKFYDEVLAQKQTEAGRNIESSAEPKRNDAYEPTYLDEFYKPILPKGKFLLDEEGSYFDNNFYGKIGNTDQYKFLGDFYYATLKNALTFSPLNNFEFGLGFNETFPDKITSERYDSQGQEAVTYHNKLNYIKDYIVKARVRLKYMEFYLDILEKTQKSSLESMSYSVTDDLRKYRLLYKDFKIGARYISSPEFVSEESNLSKLTRPLLAKGQISMEGEVGYKEGKSKRHDEYFDNVRSEVAVDQVMNPHFIPKLTLIYGLSQDLEVETGLYYETPYKYKYNELVNYYSGATLGVSGVFKVKNDFTVPLQMHWRPIDNAEVAFASDFRFAQQNIDYYNKATTGITTIYPTKKLAYMNIVPTLTLSYLNDNDKKIEKDEFSALTKQLLLEGQYLLEFEAKKDITQLNKGSAGGTQNILDPDNLFLYPVDFFVHGTEYAFMDSGNRTLYVTNVSAQNYYQLKGTITYAFADSFNAGVTLGYHSGSHLNNFVLPDRENKFCKFKPYGFIDPFFDWRITQNSLLSLWSHIVPKYKTFYLSDLYPNEFKSENRYFDVNVALKMMF